MAIIGTFTKKDTAYHGHIRTLTVDAEVIFNPNTGENEKAPDFTLKATSNGAEIGAAWLKTSEKGNKYLSVKLDDPAFPAPVYATMSQGEDGQAVDLIFERRTKSAKSNGDNQ